MSRKRALVETADVEDTSSRRFRSRVVSTEIDTLKAELEHERSLRSIEQKRSAQVQQRLERKVEFAVEEAKEAKSILEEIKHEHERHIYQMRNSRDAAIRELRECQMQLEEQAITESKMLGDRQARTRDDFEYNQLVSQNESLQEQLQILQEKLRSFASNKPRPATPPPNKDTLPGVRSPAPAAVLRELNRVRIDLADSERINGQLKRSVEDYTAKSKELAHLRESSASANARIEQLEASLKETNEEYEDFKARSRAWDEFGSAITTALSDSQLPASDSTLPPQTSLVLRRVQEWKNDAETWRENLARAKNLCGEAEAKASNTEKKCKQLEQKVQALQASEKDLKAELLNATHQVKLMKATEAILKRETESLRSIARVMDGMPRNAKSGDISDNYGFPSEKDSLKASLRTAEDLANALEETNKKIQTDLDQVIKEKSDLQKQHNTVMEKFGKLREAVYAEREKAAQAEARACKAETLAGKGSFDPEKTRAVHLKHNPLTEALKQEVSVLRKQLKSMSGGKTPKSASSEVDPEKLHQRLKESFKEQIGRFREGVYLMTGYKIDMIPGNERPMFRLRSLFAEQEHDHLMFQWPQGDHVTSLDLMSTDFAKSLTSTHSYEYIRKFHSLPAFLASVQLNLFEKQTIM